MRRLMLLRHAKSDWSAPGMPDRSRTLAPRGRDAAPRMGQYMANEGLLPDHVIVSPAERTRETWRLVAGALPGRPATVFDARLYEAAVEDILAAIADAPEAAQTLLVIGHNPGLQETALFLSGAGARDMRRALKDKFPTAALAVLDVGRADWARLDAGCGRLDRFVSPRALGALTD